MRKHANSYPYEYQRYDEGWHERAESFGARLYAARKHYGLTQANLAQMCQDYADEYEIDVKFNASTISQYENKICSPKTDKLLVLTRVLKTTVSSLTGYGPCVYNFKVQRGFKFSSNSAS